MPLNTRNISAVAKVAGTCSAPASEMSAAEQNAQFNAAVPAGDLPRLQVADVGDVSTDYGDYFVAGLVGGILAAERRPQAVAALAAFVAAQAFNQLFLVVDSLPGTVPPALVLLGFEVRQRRELGHLATARPRS